MPSVPHCVERSLFALCIIYFAFFWHHGETAPYPGETCCLGEAAELHSNLVGSWNLENRFWQLRIADKAFVGCVEQNQGVVGLGVVHPFLKLLLGGCCSGRVVGEAQVDHICLL